VAQGADTRLLTRILGQAETRIAAELGELPEVEASIRKTLGRAQDNLGQYERAESNLRRAEELFLGLFGPDDFERSRTLGEGDAHTLEALGNLALVLQAQERYDEAEEAEREALERMRATLGPENPQTLNVLNNLGACLREQGRAAEAEEIWRECLAPRERVLGPRHVDTLRSLSSLAMLLLEQGRNQEAIPLLEQALAGQKELLGEDHQDTKSSKYRLAFLLKAEHRHAEAAVLLGEVAEHDRRSLGEDDPSYGIALYNWAGTLQDAGQTAEAERIFREVLELHARHGWLEEPYTAATLNGLAKVLEVRGEHGEADELFQEALHLRRELFGRGELSYSLWDYGEVLLERRDYEGAEPLLRELVDIIPHVRRAGDWRIGSSQALLERCLALQRRFAGAQPLLEAAAGALVNDAEAKPSVVENALDWLIELFERWHEAEPTAGHDQQAAAWRARRAARESTQ
jgi:tetratricopeptide (TPR) repeat protein